MTAETPSLPPVYFNHLYGVLDNKTYRAIIASDFLRIAFPGIERRSTLTAAGENWTGTYFYCQDNYLEFFGSGSNPVSGSAARGGHWQPGAQEGWGGIAFSTDQPGGAAAVRSAIQAAFGYEPFCELRQLQAGEKNVNWFTNVKLAERMSMGSFESWVMEYHPDIFAHKNLPLPADGRLTRQAYLAPWNQTRTQPTSGEPTKTSADPQGGKAARRSPATRAAEQEAAPPPAASRSQVPIPQPVFTRVIGATFHMDEHRAERFAEILTLLGYQKGTRGDALTLSAHGFTLEIEPEELAPFGYRLSSVRLEMSRPSVAPMTFVFAPRSRLILREDMVAEWRYGE